MNPSVTECNPFTPTGALRALVLLVPGDADARLAHAVNTCVANNTDVVAIRSRMTNGAADWECSIENFRRRIAEGGCCKLRGAIHIYSMTGAVGREPGAMSRAIGAALALLARSDEVSIGDAIARATTIVRASFNC